MDESILYRLSHYKKTQELLEKIGDEIVLELNPPSLSDEDLEEYIKVSGPTYIRFCLIEEKIKRQRNK